MLRFLPGLVQFYGLIKKINFFLAFAALYIIFSPNNGCFSSQRGCTSGIKGRRKIIHFVLAIIISFSIFLKINGREPAVDEMRQQ